MANLSDGTLPIFLIFWFRGPLIGGKFVDSPLVARPALVLMGLALVPVARKISCQTQNAQATSASLGCVEVKIKGRPRSKAAALILVNKCVEMENPDTTYIPQ